MPDSLILVEESPAKIRRFFDGSALRYYADGSIGVHWLPANLQDSPPPAPQCWLYYWNVIRNRPDITTWEQVRAANKTDEARGDTR